MPHAMLAAATTTSAPAGALGGTSLSLLSLGAVLLAVALGAAMLFWGRLVHRAVLAVIGVGAGLALGGWLAEKVNLHPMVGRLVLAATFGILAVVVARVVWAVLAGAVLASIAYGAVLGSGYNAPLTTQPAPGAPPTVRWSLKPPQLEQAAREALDTAMAGNADRAMAAAGAAALLALALGLFLPRATVVVLTSFVGASLVMGGVVLAMLLWFVVAAMEDSPLPLAIWAALWLAGLVVQAVGEIRCRRKEAKESQGPARSAAEPKGAK